MRARGSGGSLPRVLRPPYSSGNIGSSLAEDVRRLPACARARVGSWSPRARAGGVQRVGRSRPPSGLAIPVFLVYLEYPGGGCARLCPPYPPRALAGIASASACYFALCAADTGAAAAPWEKNAS